MKWKKALSKQIRIVGNENYGVRNLKFNRMFKRYSWEFFKLINWKDTK